MEPPTIESAARAALRGTEWDLRCDIGIGVKRGNKSEEGGRTPEVVDSSSQRNFA